MGNKRLASLIVLAAISGTLYGLVSSSPGAAQTPQVHLTVNPGSTREVLTCGWHDTCLAGMYGARAALDWGNFAGWRIYWRSWGWRGDGGFGPMGSATIWQDHSNCFRVTVTTYDWWGYYQGAIHYTHSDTDKSGEPFLFSGGNGTWLESEVVDLGWSVGSEIGGCPFEDPHLHQNGPWQYGRNTGYPDAPSTGSGTYPIWAFGYWQNDRQW
jgi:hypothetical protein